METETQHAAKPKYWYSIVLISVVVPLIFWLRFGRVDGFAIAFTAFLLLLITTVQFLQNPGGKYENGGVKKLSPSRFDKLGVVWLLSIPFAPFLSWMIAEFFTITIYNWHAILGIKAGLCVVLPCICVLPLVRYINGRTAFVAGLILVIGTCFPVIIGWNSMVDLIEGPQDRSMVVREVHNIYYTRNYKDTPTDIVEITLDDGRVFEANDKYVSVKPGTETLTVLEHVGVVIGRK